MRRRREGELGVFTGASRQGKTYQVKKHTARARRVIVWSVKERVDRYASNWRGAVIVPDLGELRGRIVQARTGPAVLVYAPRDLADFSRWAELAHAMGIVEPCTVIAEELADVTHPGKAPPGWGDLVRQGLGWGVNIYAVTQSPAESDKTVFRNASFFHTHYMPNEPDRRTMAARMDIKPGDIQALKKYEWIRVGADRKVRRGR